MKKTLKSFIIFSIVFVLLFPNITVIAASVSDDLRVTNTIYEAVQTINSEPTSSAQTGDIEIYIREELPVNGVHSSFEITLTNESNAEDSHTNRASLIPNSNTLYCSFKDKSIGKYTLTINGDHYVPYTQTGIELGNEIVTLNFTNVYEKDDTKDSDREVNHESKAGVLAYGDVNEDKIIDEKDRTIMISEIESQKNNPKYDLNKDGDVNIVDLSYISFNIAKEGEGQKEVYASTLKSMKMQNIEVGTPDEVEVIGEIEDIKEKNDSYVSLKPSNNEKISENNPVEISLNLPDDNTHPTGAIVISPSTNPENNIKQGYVEITFGENKKETFYINDPNGDTSGDTSGDRIAVNLPFEVLLASNGIAPINLDYVEIDKDGSIIIDLHGQIAIKKVTIKVTKTGSNTLADISQVEFLNSMDDRIPAPDMNIPTNLRGTPRK